MVKKCADISTLEFFVIEGLRTIEQEQADVAAGKSQTMHSRHLGGFAVDLGIMVDGALTWGPTYYQQLYSFMQAAATALSIPVVWGGSWKTLKDLDHFELDHNVYPDHTPLSA